ncbi:MAG: hypothetical protein OEY49_12655 [Candidatus Heimdallarchaeota archaeon]|nr:hypothetical protein [Candidatus Heimdallarchaeota archaeon]
MKNLILKLQILTLKLLPFLLILSSGKAFGGDTMDEFHRPPMT